MAMENGTEWLEIRKRIKNKLGSCPYINPFIIEDKACEISSVDYFSYQVSISDIVILLIKEELRKGVEVEISVATKHKKPMLIYFHSEGIKDLKTEAFKKDIEQNDYCTYKLFDNFDSLEDVIYDDLIQNIIQYYQFEHYKKAIAYNTTNSIMPEQVNNTFPIVSEVKKSNIKIFKKCSEYLWNKLVFDGKQQSPDFENADDEFLFNYGISILNYIIGEGQFPDQQMIVKFIDLIKKYHCGEDWITYRWDSIRYYNLGQYNEALSYTEKARDSAQANNAPDWLIDNILIDCRNIEFQISNISRVYQFKYQNIIDKRESLIYLPVSDRFLEKAFEESIDNFFKITAHSPYTNQFGSNMKEALTNIENYIFSALIYGSNTHILISRVALSKIFYIYGISFDDGNILFKSLVFMLLAKEYSDFDKLISHYWQKLYINVTQNVEKLWLLACKANRKECSRPMIMLYRVLGPYMSDELFSKATGNIREIVENTHDDYSSELLKAINNNLLRINKPIMIDILNILLENKVIFLYSDFCKILLNADFSNINADNEAISNLDDLLTRNLDNILENNGQCYFIGNLRKAFSDRFVDIEKAALEKVDETEKLLYKLSFLNTDIENNLKHFVNMAQNQFEQNSKGGSFSGFWYKPLRIIENIMINNFDKNMMTDILVNEFIPLCRNILTSYVPFSMKTECIEALISIIQAFLDNDIIYDWNGFLESILLKKENIEAGLDFSVFENNSPEIFKLKFILLKTFCSYNTKEEIMLKYFSLNRMDELERLAVAECIRQYIKCNHLKNDDYESLFVPIIFNMSSDTYFEVRVVICECLAMLFCSKYKDAIRSKLFELSLDEVHHIKITILKLIESIKIDDMEFSLKMLQHLSTDSCYNIRVKSKEITNKLQ